MKEVEVDIDLEDMVDNPIYENAFYSVAVLAEMTQAVTGIYVAINKEHKVVEFADAKLPKVLNWVESATTELKNITTLKGKQGKIFQH